MRSRSVTRRLHHLIFDQSRAGRAYEVAAWANGASALAIALGVGWLLWPRVAENAIWIALVAAVVAFVGLRLSLAHRMTVWIAATTGTLTIASLGAALAWVFGHVIETPAAPSVAAAIGALAAAALPAWSYAHLAARRARDVRDSLIDPVSVPASRPSR